MVAGAGELRERVAFEARVQGDDGFGNPEGAFAHRFERAASIAPRLGGEEVMAARLSGRQPATITIRYCKQAAEITTDWRVRDVRAGTIYGISAISNPDRKKKYLELLCLSGKGVAV
jgi:SPP1 family predicted phage head-tail adaptor